MENGFRKNVEKLKEQLFGSPRIKNNLDNNLKNELISNLESELRISKTKQDSLLNEINRLKKTNKELNDDNDNLVKENEYNKEIFENILEQLVINYNLTTEFIESRYNQMLDNISNVMGKNNITTDNLEIFSETLPVYGVLERFVSDNEFNKENVDTFINLYFHDINGNIEVNSLLETFKVMSNIFVKWSNKENFHVKDICKQFFHTETYKKSGVHVSNLVEIMVDEIIDTYYSLPEDLNVIYNKDPMSKLIVAIIYDKLGDKYKEGFSFSDFKGTTNYYSRFGCDTNNALSKHMSNKSAIEEEINISSVDGLMRFGTKPVFFIKTSEGTRTNVRYNII